MKQSTNRSKESLNSAQSTGGVNNHSKESLCFVQSTGGVAKQTNASNTTRNINSSQIDEDEECKTIDNVSIENQAIEEIGEDWNSNSHFQSISQRKRDIQAADEEEDHEQQRLQHFELLKNQTQQTTPLPSYYPVINDSFHAHKYPLPSSSDVRNGPILQQTVTNDLSVASTDIVRTTGPKDTNLHSEFDVIETKNITDITSSSVFTKSIGSIFSNINKQVSSAITNLITNNDPVPACTVSQTSRHNAGPRSALTPVCGSELLRGFGQTGQNSNLIGQYEIRQTPQNKRFGGDPLTDVDLISYSTESHEQKDKVGRAEELHITSKPFDLSAKSSSNQHTVNDPYSLLNGSLISSRQTSIPQPGAVRAFQPIRTAVPVPGGQSPVRGQVSHHPQGSGYKKPTVDDCTEEHSVSSLPHLQRHQSGKDQSSLFSNKSSLDLPSQTLAHNLSQATFSSTDRYQSQSPIALRSENPSPMTAFKDWNSVTAKKTGFRVLPLTPSSKPSVLNLISSHMSVDRMPRLLPSPSVPISQVPSDPDCINFPHLSASPSHFDLGEESYRRSGIPSRADDSQIRQSNSFTAAWSDQFGRSFSSQQLRQTGLGLHDVENNRARYTSQTLNKPLRYEPNKREYEYQPMIGKGNHYRQVRDNISTTSRTAAPSDCIEISRFRRDSHLASVASLPRNYPVTQNFKPNIKPVNRERIYSSTRLLRRDVRDTPEDDDSDSDDEDWC